MLRIDDMKKFEMPMHCVAASLPEKANSSWSSTVEFVTQTRRSIFGNVSAS